MEVKYKIVPVEPSQEMIDEAAEWLYGCSRARAIEIAKEEKFDSYCNDAGKVWSSMLGLCETTLSDLEIVQKALDKEDRQIFLSDNGCLYKFVGDAYDLLTWAKQTVGIK